MKLRYRLWGIVGIVLMSPFSWQGQNLCGLSLVFVKDWRVVSSFSQMAIYETQKSPFIFPHHNQTKSCIKLKPTYVEAQGPHCFGKVSFVTFRTADTENIGDIHRVPKAVFSLSSYILVLIQEAMENFVFPNNL